MKSTLDLLDMALETAKSPSALSVALHMHRNTLTRARAAGRLSPIAAGKIADHIGQPIAEWMALAALEAEPDIPVSPAIQRLVDKVRKS